MSQFCFPFRSGADPKHANFNIIIDRKEERNFPRVCDKKIVKELSISQIFVFIKF
jgi:hypothetical protein